jgi:hypothetical protein
MLLRRALISLNHFPMTLLLQVLLAVGSGLIILWAL